MTDTQRACGSALGKHRDVKPPVVDNGKKASTILKKVLFWASHSKLNASGIKVETAYVTSTVSPLGAGICVT